MILPLDWNLMSPSAAFPMNRVTWESDTHHNAQAGYKLYRCSHETEPTSSAAFIIYRGKQGEVRMVRYLPILMLSLAILPTSVPAEEGRAAAGHRGTLQQQRACRSDVLRHCRDIKDQDDYAIAVCLKAHEHQLSPACRQALKEDGR
jgi:hypothetical protein